MAINIDTLTLIVSSIAAIMSYASYRMGSTRNEEERKRDREMKPISLISTIEASYSNEPYKEKIAAASSKLIVNLELISMNWPNMESSYPDYIHEVILNLKETSKYCERYVKMLDPLEEATSSVFFSNESDLNNFIYNIKLFPLNLCPLMLYYLMHRDLNYQSNNVIKKALLEFTDPRYEVNINDINIFLEICNKVKLHELEYADEQIQHIRDYINESIEEQKAHDRKLIKSIHEACEHYLIKNNNTCSNTE